MKFLLALALLSTVAIADEAKKEEAAVAPEAQTEAVHKDMKADKKAAYKAAKEACLKKDKDLKGKKLKECIISETNN